MEKKSPVFLFLGVLVCLLILPASTTSGHVVNPGAKIRGFIIPQSYFADLNEEGIAWVPAAEIGIVSEHKSEVTGVGFLLEDSQEVRLNGSIPAGTMTVFTLRIGYSGQPGDVVPIRRVRLTLNLVRVHSPDHGENQQVEIVEPPPVPPQGGTITLR